VPDAELVALVESQEEVADEVPVEPFPDGFTPESTAAQGGDDDE
jgi:hypothetical protein